MNSLPRLFGIDGRVWVIAALLAAVLMFAEHIQKGIL